MNYNDLTPVFVTVKEGEDRGNRSDQCITMRHIGFSRDGHSKKYTKIDHKNDDKPLGVVLSD